MSVDELRPVAPLPSAAAISWWREPTRDQWLTWTAICIAWVLDVWDFAIFLLLMVPISQQLRVPLTAVAAILSATLWLRLPGAVMAGWLADRMGRKKPLMISILVYSLSNLAAGLSPSYGVLLLFRATFGLGMGAEWPVGSALAMESWPARSRGFMSAVLQGSSNLGFVLASVTYGLLFQRIGWRGLLMIGVLPALLVLFLVRSCVRESAVWQKNNRRRAERNCEPAMPLLRIFRRGMISNTLTACWWITSSFILYYSITGLFAVHLQKDLKLSPALVATPVALAGLLTFVASALWGLVADRAGRRWAMIIPAGFAVIIAPAYLLSHDLPLIIMAYMIQGLFGMAVSGQQPSYLAERFPTEVRATASGFIYQLGSFVAGFVPVVLTAIASRFAVGLGVSMLVGTIFGATNVILSLLWAPETKGKPLDA